jgi:hypothetical protein
MSQITINDAQTRALADVLGEYGDGTEMTLTQQQSGELVVAFSLVTITISVDGDVESV